MTRTLAILAVTIAAAGTLQAHHSGSMYDPTAIWVTGTVIRVDNINPHTITIIETTGEDGLARLWGIEGPGRSQLGRRGLASAMPAIGDVIEVCAFDYKSVEELSQLWPDADFSSPRTISTDRGEVSQFGSGHLIVREDGTTGLWNPHGVISDCIRSSDAPRSVWLEFLDSNAMAEQAWCEQREYTVVQSNESLGRFIAEVEASLEGICAQAR